MLLQVKMHPNATFFSVFNHLCTTLLSLLQRVSPSPASCHRLSGATPAPPCLMVWSLSILTWLVAQHARDSRRKRPQRLQDLFQKTTVIKIKKNRAAERTSLVVLLVSDLDFLLAGRKLIELRASGSFVGHLRAKMWLSRIIGRSVINSTGRNIQL